MERNHKAEKSSFRSIYNPLAFLIQQHHFYQIAILILLYFCAILKAVYTIKNILYSRIPMS